MKILLKAPFNIGEVKFVESMYSIPAPLQEKTENIWREQTQLAHKSGRPLWNGEVYRFDGIEANGKLNTLVLSTLDYKTYLASSRIHDELAKLPFSKRPNGMYVASHVVTCDGKVLLGKTSKSSPFPHKYDLISGSLNRDEHLISSMGDITKSWIAEFEEETGVSSNHIEKMQELCIMVTSSGRIGIFYCSYLDMSSEEVKKSAKNNFEHESLMLLSISELQELTRSATSKCNPTIAVTYSLIPP